MIDPTKEDIGRKVLYHGHPFSLVENLPKEGVITSFNEYFVFVRYGNDEHPKAAKRYYLEWML